MKLVIGVLLLSPAVLCQVPYDRIRAARSEPGNWLTYSGSYDGHRYSPLKQITKANVRTLKLAWVYQFKDPNEVVETSPIVVDGIIYLTEKPHVATALDGRTGRALWTYHRTTPADAQGCCGPVNRGLAILDDGLFFGTYDAHLVALDSRTGTLRWDVVVADYKQGYRITAAPLALKDKIIVGISGGDQGIRGFLDSYDPKTGQRNWRFWTVPAPGEPGHETWEGDSWKTGGAPTWVTGSFDPELNTIYWGTGNPGPDYNGDDREGDNLYSDSLLAIDANSGKLRWHFQFTPHDLHDWDSNQVPLLIDLPINSRTKKLVVQANRNAFYYVLDRETGDFICGTPYVKQTWARGLDAKGRPIRNPEAAPSPQGTVVFPAVGGATNWFSPSFSPQTKLFYVQARENYGNVFYKLKADYVPGDLFLGGSTSGVAGIEPYGVVKALEVNSGKLRWEFRLNEPSSGGLLSTAGGLVFGGSNDGYFFALDADSGNLLWRFQTGGEICANPITFLVAGKQHVAIAAGQALFVFVKD